MKIIDLTLAVSDKIPTFPGSPQPSFIPWENVKEDGYNLELLFLSTHTGTLSEMKDKKETTQILRDHGWEPDVAKKVMRFEIGRAHV